MFYCQDENYIFSQWNCLYLTANKILLYIPRNCRI
nr:MAG TPA: hypothetical protein [Caudoviricetes sp.]